MIVIFLSLLSITFLAAWFWFLRNNRRNWLKQKTAYAEMHNKKISLEDFYSNSDSIVGYNAGLMSNVVQIDDNCAWQDAKITIPGGARTVILDTLFFSDRGYTKKKRISELLMIRINPSYDGGEPSEEAIQFLDEYNLSLDAGPWGALLIKNKGNFNATDVDVIVKKFRSLSI